ncbi:MAG: flagellar biosynthetic protein FliO [Planctomycetota bacterium]
MSRLKEASRCHDRPHAQLLRRRRAHGACPRTICAALALAVVSPVLAQATSANEPASTDAAVEAIQRARALAERRASEPASPDTANTAAAESIVDAPELDAAAPRPLGLPSNSSSPIDRASAVDGNTGWVLSTLSALGVVLGLVFLARWCLTRMQNGGEPVARTAAVEVLSRVPIGNRQRVMLLRIGGRIVVVGDAGGSLSTLAEIDDEQEVAELLQSVSANRSNSAASGFRDLYRQMAGGPAERADRRDDALDPAADPRDAYGDRSQDEVRRLLSRVRGAATSIAGGTGGSR